MTLFETGDYVKVRVLRQGEVKVVTGQLVRADADKGELLIKTVRGEEWFKLNQLIKD